jgi:hypothetical protein
MSVRRLPGHRTRRSVCGNLATGGAKAKHRKAHVSWVSQPSVVKPNICWSTGRIGDGLCANLLFGSANKPPPCSSRWCRHSSLSRVRATEVGLGFALLAIAVLTSWQSRNGRGPT